MSIWIASFDIGKKNFAFCIEEVNENIKIDKRISENEKLEQTCMNGKIILLKNIDLTINTDKNKYLDPIIFVNMYKTLTEYKAYWDKCSTIIVEQQMGFGKNRNPMALKLGQHCYSFFIFNYATFKNIIEFPAYHKTKVFIQNKKLNKNQRKKWSVEKASEILIKRQDLQSLKQINDCKKKDDMADVIMQLQSYKYLHIINGS